MKVFKADRPRYIKQKKKLNMQVKINAQVPATEIP